MVLARCDINTCKKEVELAQIRRARLLDNEYDLCDDCLKSLLSFIQIRLTGGRDTTKDKQPSLTLNPGFSWGGIQTTQNPFPQNFGPTITIPGTILSGSALLSAGGENLHGVGENGGGGGGQIKVNHSINMSAPFEQILAQLGEVFEAVNSLTPLPGYNPQPSVKSK